MTTRNPTRHIHSRRNRFPIQTAAIELCVCMAVYVAFWVFLRALAPPDAAAALAPASPMEQSAAPTVWTSPAGVSESPPSDVRPNPG